MSKTLVIRGADFSANRLDSVSLAVVQTAKTPCAGLSLNKKESSLTAIWMSERLTAATTPPEGTYTVGWTSSNPSVATVSNGVVTAVGVGRTMISAYCGSFSDSCMVTVTATMDTPNAVKVARRFLWGVGANKAGNGLPTMYGETARQGVVVSNTGTYTYYANEGHGLPTYYPYNLPAGTMTIQVTIPNNDYRLNRIHWFNRNIHADKGYNTVCKLIDMYGSDEVATYKNGLIYTIPVPTFEGFPAIDAIGLNFMQTVEGAVFQDTDFDGIQVLFFGD